MNDFCKTLPPSNFRRLPYFRTTDHLARSSTQELWSHGHDGQIITPENHERWNEIKPRMLRCLVPNTVQHYHSLITRMITIKQ